MVKILLALPVVAVPVWLAWASWRGRVRLRCCGTAACDDLRMRAAFEDDEPGPRRQEEARPPLEVRAP